MGDSRWDLCTDHGQNGLTERAWCLRSCGRIIKLEVGVRSFKYGWIRGSKFLPCCRVLVNRAIMSGVPSFSRLVHELLQVLELCMAIDSIDHWKGVRALRCYKNSDIVDIARFRRIPRCPQTCTKEAPHAAPSRRDVDRHVSCCIVSQRWILERRILILQGRDGRGAAWLGIRGSSIGGAA